MAQPSALSRSHQDACPAPGSLASHSSPLYLFHKNALQANSDPTDVHGILEGTANNAGNLVLVPVPLNSLYLELMHLSFADATGTTLDTHPVVQVFGRIPRPGPTLEGDPIAYLRSLSTPPVPLPPRLMEDGQTAFRIPSLRDSASDDLKANVPGYWRPLTKPGYTRGTPELTLDETAQSTTYDPAATSFTTAAGTAVYRVSEPQYVWVAGCTHVLVPVVTAAAFSAGNNVSLIVGHFTS